MPFARNGSVRLFYEVVGPRDYAGGMPLALAHGFGVSSEMWDWQREPLSERRRLVLWDARGHGESGAPVSDEAYSMPLMARDLAAVLDDAGIERAAIGGMSFGGMIALQFAVDFPERAQALILSDSVPPRPEDASRAEPPGGGGAFRAMMQRPDLTSALPTLTAPALVIYGEYDQRVAEGVPRLAKGLRDCRVVQLDGCTHGTSAQRPREWTDAVLAFLDDVDAGRPVRGEMTL